jgi:CDP-glycerol glycerophosphotransferase (TagB/SpsB family)
MSGYDPLNRDYKGFIEKNNADLIVISEDHTTWPFNLCEYARENNFPIVNVIGEGIISDFTRDSFFDKIQSYKNSVWGDVTKNYFYNLGLNPENRVVVNGPPRFDVYSDKSKILSKKKMCEEINKYEDKHLDPNKKIITFFSYPPHAFIATQLFESGVNYKKLRAETIALLCKNAKYFEDNGYQIVLKAHPSEADRFVHNNIKRNIGLDAENICVLGLDKYNQETQVHNLISNTDIAVGYQSTTMVESMICKKPIVLTYWDKLASRNDLIPYDKRGVGEVCRKKEDFGKTIQNIIENDYEISEEMQKNRESFIYDYCFQIDGKSGERVANTIIEVLEDFYYNE